MWISSGRPCTNFRWRNKSKENIGNNGWIAKQAKKLETPIEIFKRKKQEGKEISRLFEHEGYSNKGILNLFCFELVRLFVTRVRQLDSAESLKARHLVMHIRRLGAQLNWSVGTETLALTKCYNPGWVTKGRGGDQAFFPLVIYWGRICWNLCFINDTFDLNRLALLSFHFMLWCLEVRRKKSSNDVQIRIMMSFLRYFLVKLWS